MTNIDRIKNMNANELAEFMHESCCLHCSFGERIEDSEFARCNSMKKDCENGTILYLLKEQ